MNAIKTTQKRAYKQIQAIKNASNMVEVEILINNTILDVFRLRNFGLMKIYFSTKNRTMLNYFGCLNYKCFEDCKRIRTIQYKLHKHEVAAYLVSFIPEKLRHSKKYFTLVYELKKVG